MRRLSVDLVLMKTYIRTFLDETFVDVPLEACSAAIQVHDQGGREEHIRRNCTANSYRTNPLHSVMALDVLRKQLCEHSQCVGRTQKIRAV